jgi:hypothetical protein
MIEYHILASVSIAQAAVESGWGASAPGNNLFGIKANGWTGKTQVLKTTEIVDGKAISVKASFRAYRSWAQSMDDHGAFLASNSRYANILGVSDYHTACHRLQADGYSTSPSYANLLIGIINQYRLYQYDRLPPITTLDMVTVKDGVVLVSGWALNMAGLMRIDVYYDGNHGVGGTTAFTDRPDVDKTINPHGWYPDGGRCGFNFTIQAGRISKGTHTLNVAAIGKDGSAQWAGKDFSL